MATNTKSTTASSSTRPHRLLTARMVQNFHLVWLDGSIDETNDDCRDCITKLREVVHTVNTFVDADDCIDFITDIEENVFVVISEQFSEDVISIIQNISQVYCIYIFYETNVPYQKRTKEQAKMNGVFTDITSLCETLKQAIIESDYNSVSISYVKKTDEVANQSIDRLDCSFMYTQILKEILLTIDFEQINFNEFITYCREQFANSITDIKNVDKIEKEYHRDQAIWWYTYQCFLYSMLNRALRLMEADLITTMGFFVRDLHEHIAALHAEQYGGQNHSNSFIVYRGQALSQADFNQLQTTQGGLLAFNNFLSTSQNRQVSLEFARRTINTSDKTGILFVMTIDPSISATPFANVKNASCYKREEEILFSMHSVFRIGQVKQIEKNNDRLWQVELTLTSDHDPQLQELTKSIQEDTKGSTGWFRLGKLMMKVARLDEAQQVFEMILHRTTDEKKKDEIYYYLAWIKNDQGKHTEALSYYEKSLEIRRKTLPANHPHLATSYNNIGNVYYNMGEYSKALSYYEKALEILQKTLPVNHPHLATSYNNIGLVYYNMGEYSKTLSYYEKVLEILQKTLPANHPHLATSYNNIGLVYYNMGEYSKALSYYEKVLEILQKTLPANHPNLASSYNSIGEVYRNMGEYSKALSNNEKALEIQQKALPANHPHLATSYNNIGGMYKNMGEYSKGLSYYEKALGIYQKTLPANHPHLATSYNNIGGVYRSMGEYSKALSYYEKALEIKQKTLPENHPSLANSYNNIGLVYDNMGEYSKALSYYERALDIKQRSLPPNHPSIKNVKKSI
jgi:tetratricopeptide (TPR) repeat protein